METTVQLSSEAEEARRRDRLVPFADRIELIVRAFERSSRPYRLGLGSWQGEKEDIVRRYAEDHALAHSSLPTGRARLRRGVEVDFDALAAEAARARALFPLPTTYRLPRHEREPFYGKQIDALVSAFDDRFVAEPGPERGNLFWFERFLEDYVVDSRMSACAQNRALGLSDRTHSAIT
jgi:hypothetical protein